MEGEGPSTEGKIRKDEETDNSDDDSVSDPARAVLPICEAMAMGGNHTSTNV